MEPNKPNSKRTRSRNSRILAIILFLTVVATTFSCDRRTVYAHYAHTPITGWEKNDTLTYGPIKITTSDTFHEEVGLRINGNYPFQSLCLIIEHRVLPQGTTFIDTLDCALVNGEGRTLGQGINYYQYKWRTNDHLFNSGDSVYIYIRHNMKREILPGVSDIGVKLTEK